MSDLMCAVRALCIRHGSAEEDPQDDDHDPPLSADGRAQVRALCASLAAERIAVVYASPARRAQETADLLGAALGVPVRSTSGLSEVTAGSLDASNRPEDDEHVRTTFRAWLDGDLGRRVGEGETGHQVVARLSGVLETVADLHRGETVALVSHGGLLPLGLTALCADLRPAWVLDRPLGNAAVVEMAYDQAGWRCRSWAGEQPAYGPL